MADEIERKFLVPADSTFELPESGVRLRQGYLAIDGQVEVRVRSSEAGSVLTVKAGAGRVRTEVERSLTADEADALWPHTEGRRVEKVRYAVALDGGLVAEVDVYEGALAGLRTVEVEFADEESADTFAIPAWIGRELTSETGWSNAALALRGRPADTG
jgi:adenylate cyclase